MSEKKLFARLFLYVFGPLCAATITFLLLSRYFVSPANPLDTKRRFLFIDANLEFHQVGELLKEAGLVRNATAIPIILELQGTQGPLLTGEYGLSPSMTPREIVEILLSGVVEKRSMQVRNGDTIRTVSEALGKAGVLGATEAMKAFTDPILLAKSGVSGPSFEGYLGIGFYQFQKPITAQEVIWRMLELSEKNWRPDFKTQATKLKRSRHDIITLASLVFAESPSPDFYKGLAGVYRNRLKAGLPLESLQALKYVLQKKKIPADLQKVESPYNTFANVGLPPGPINNPSIESIEAVLFTEEEQFTHMLVVGGKVEFFKDQRSYELAKQRYMLQ